MATIITRRSLLQRVLGLGVAAGAATTLLAACGGAPAAAPKPAEPTKPAAAPTTAAATSAAPGAAAKAGPATEISYWFFVGGPNLETMKGLVEKVNGRQPSVKATVQYVPGQEITAKALAAMAAGTPPHVTWTPTGGWAALGFARQGGLIPLDDLVKADFKEQAADYLDYIWKANIWQGKIWGIPLDTNNLTWFYNEALLKAAGVTPPTANPTWDELTAIMKATTKDGTFGYQATGEARYFYDFLKQAGGELANEDYTRAKVNSPEGEQTLAWLRDMVYQSKTSPNPPAQKGFESGLVALEYEGSYRIPVYRKLTDIKVAAMPISKKQVPFTVNGGESLLIWKTNPAIQEAAWTFVKGMTTPETIAEWASASGYLPVRTSVLEAPAYKEVLKQDPIRQVFVDALRYGGFWLATPYGNDLYTVITDQVNRVLLKDEPIKAVLSDLEKQMNDIMAGKKAG